MLTGRHVKYLYVFAFNLIHYAVCEHEKSNFISAKFSAFSSLEHTWCEPKKKEAVRGKLFQ